METIYNVDYFIKKFEAIPEENFHTGDFKNEDGTKFCAFGHCGMRNFSDKTTDFKEALALRNLSKPLGEFISIVDINDGNESLYKQPTPKQRVLAALYDIKKLNGEPEAQECDATEVEKSVTADTIKTTNEFSPVTFEKITELIPELSNS